MQSLRPHVKVVIGMLLHCRQFMLRQPVLGCATFSLHTGVCYICTYAACQQHELTILCQHMRLEVAPALSTTGEPMSYVIVNGMQRLTSSV